MKKQKRERGTKANDEEYLKHSEMVSRAREQMKLNAQGKHAQREREWRRWEGKISESLVREHFFNYVTRSNGATRYATWMFEGWKLRTFEIWNSSEMTMTETMMMRYVDEWEEFRMNESQKKAKCKTYWAFTFNMRTNPRDKKRRKLVLRPNTPSLMHTGRMWWFILLIRVKHIYSPLSPLNHSNDFKFFPSFRFFFTIHRVGVSRCVKQLKGSCSNE